MSCNLSPYAQGRLARRNGIAQWQSPFKYGTQAAAWQAGWLDERNTPQELPEAVRDVSGVDDARHDWIASILQGYGITDDEIRGYVKGLKTSQVSRE